MKTKMNLVTHIIAVSLLLQACMASDNSKASADYAPGEDDSNDYSDSNGDDNYFPPNRDSESVVVGPALLNPEAMPCNAETVSQYALSPTGNAMAGPVLVREALQSGTLPRGPIRDAEFLNYYNIGYPINETAAPLISITTRPEDATAGGDARVNLRLAVLAPKIPEDEALPLNLTVAVDTSASMMGNGISRAKAACRALVNGLNPGDIVSLVTWNADSEIVLDAMFFDDSVSSQMDAACDSLAANVDKGTDLHNGLTAAYESALPNSATGRINHIVFLSDGGAIAGVTDRELIETYAERSEENNIYLSTFGSAASPAQYNENLMKMFADAGKGEHLYADSDAEAARLINERFFPALKTVATEITLRLTLPVGYQAPEGASTTGEIDLEAPGYNLSAGKTLLFHESVSYCDRTTPSQNEISFALSYIPENNNSESNNLSAVSDVSKFISDAPDDTFQIKTEAVLSYADALRAVVTPNADNAVQRIDSASAALKGAAAAIGPDSDIDEMLNLLGKSKKLLK